MLFARGRRSEHWSFDYDALLCFDVNELDRIPIPYRRYQRKVNSELPRWGLEPKVSRA